jgi:hypothetical protein
LRELLRRKARKLLEKSMLRQRTTRSLGDDFIVFLMGETPRNISHTLRCTYASLDTDHTNEMVSQVKWILLCLVELGMLLIILMGVNI